MEPYHRKSRLQDVVDLTPLLRYEDKREVETLGQTVESALMLGYLHSATCRSIIDRNGQVVGMFGVNPISDVSGAIWLLGSPGIMKIKTTFLKRSRPEVESLNKMFPHLCNFIDSRNEVHLKWIKWCGFKIIGERLINNVKFYEFCRLTN